MIQDDGAAVREHSREVAKVRPRSQGKLTDMVVGTSRLAYSVSSEKRTMGVGLLRTMLAETSELEPEEREMLKRQREAEASAAQLKDQLAARKKAKLDRIKQEVGKGREAASAPAVAVPAAGGARSTG